MGTMASMLSIYLSPVMAESSERKFTIQGPSEQPDSAVIRDALNRPCLDVEAVARAHIVNPHLFDHVVSVKNRCPRRINIRLCYFKSDSCKVFVIGPYQREDTILGTLPNTTIFRYSIFQK